MQFSALAHILAFAAVLRGAPTGSPAPGPLATQVTPEKLTDVLHPQGERALVVHLWASWCTPCIAEMPELVSALRKLSERVDVLFVSLDGDGEASAAARLLSKAGGAPGTSVRAASAQTMRILQALDAQWDGSIPTTFLLSKEGGLILAQRGGTELGELRNEIDRIAPKAPKRAHPGRRAATKRRSTE
jgi:thiol-disulfide isomerase/thioredoxin